MSNKIESLINHLNGPSDLGVKKNSAQETKDQFLQMLIAQLKNQDPLNPVSNDRFAVDLATFSQLEQLISINEKISSNDSGLNLSASLLGKTIILKDQTFTVQNGSLQEGIFIDVPKQYESIKVSVLDKFGREVYQSTLNDFRVGKNLVSLESLDLPDGEYTITVQGIKSGNFENLKSSPAITIYGLIPGAEPKFIGGNREISLKDIDQIWSI